jgi:hypothetical protein
MHGDSFEHVTRRETTQSFLLWFGLLAGPLAWMAQTIVAPDLVEVLCYSGAAESGRAQVYGWPIEHFVLLLTAVLVAVTVAAALGSMSCLRKLRSSRTVTTGGRAGWMARGGILVSILFLISILVGALPLIFTEGCVTTP